MQGKIVIVTGANSGIGFETAKALAKMGAQVGLVCRTAAKAEEAKAAILRAVPEAKLSTFAADLASQAEIRRVAEEIKLTCPKIDVLINNAGVIENERKLSPDGIEMTFAVNHLAYFLLTHLLLDKIKAAAPSRIVNVSSAAHFGASINFDDLQGEKSYSAWRAYSQSKLANVLFTYELARRLAGTGVTANCLHPGVISTKLFRNFGLFNTLAGIFLASPEKGAETSVYLASSPEVEGITGKYFDNKRAVPSSPASYNLEDAKRLWEISAALTQVPEPKAIHRS
ncbi:MAG: SDR family oxidoreductase [Chloroherpetonaceae bacterium]|nr:SDR family oxidoreductase [Chloroherpetonaceae bacterium]MDW8467207.1 SDR family oxidoreductase [Chloroherpetonaceae bacterium]